MRVYVRIANLTLCGDNVQKILKKRTEVVPIMIRDADIKKEIIIVKRG